MLLAQVVSLLEVSVNSIEAYPAALYALVVDYNLPHLGVTMRQRCDPMSSSMMTLEESTASKSCAVLSNDSSRRALVEHMAGARDSLATLGRADMLAARPTWLHRIRHSRLRFS